MCNGILTFTNMEFGNIRIVEKDGELWFVASDICKCFGETNRNRAMQELDDDEKGYTQIQTAGCVQRVSIINEPGLYALLFAMQPEKARGVSDAYIQNRQNKLRAFRRWVTHDVLPSIRKHGMYATDELIDKILENPDWGIELLLHHRHSK